MTDSFIEALRTRLRALLSTSRLGQFAGVGVLGSAVDIAGLGLLVAVVGLSELVAKVLAWELSIVVIFAINERWTFASYGAMTPRALGKRFLRSNVVRFAGFLVTLAVYVVMLEYGFWYQTANVVGIGVGFFVNYVCECLYTWRVHRD